MGPVTSHNAVMRIRTAATADHDVIWSILEPAVRAGETLTLPRDWSRDDTLAYWFARGHEVFVADDEGGDDAAGTFLLRANAPAGGSHVANCAYVTAPWAARRGVARAMCLFSFERARARGFRAMQFNFVVSTNERAVGLWQSLGFETVGRLPGAFAHPTLGDVDALVMYRVL
jgi:ribosomal protein S18 acetylase RimI-like enzyme